MKIAAWRFAYDGLLSAELLAGLDQVGEEESWREYLAERPAGDRMWVADDGEIAGFARTGPSPQPDTPEATGEVHGLYVAPGRIGTGCGRALFGRATADLVARSFAPIVVWHFVGNERAARFYEHAGFRLDGAIRASEFGVDEVRRRFDP